MSVNSLLDSLRPVSGWIVLALDASWFAGVNLLHFLNAMRETYEGIGERIKTLLRGVWAALLLVVPLTAGAAFGGWPVLQVMLLASAGALAFSTLIVPAIGRAIHQNPAVARIVAGGLALLIGLIPITNALRGRPVDKLLGPIVVIAAALLNIGAAVWHLWHD